MNDITQQMADALRRARETLAWYSVNAEGNSQERPDEDDIEIVAAADTALAAYDAQPKRWTVFIRDADNTGTTYITCVEAEDVEAAKAEASALCRGDWGYDETAQLHILGVIAGDIGDVVE